jgi:hypothetical protein
MSLREGNGALLIQGTTALVRPNGILEPVESPDDPRPYELRWVDADCAPCGPLKLRTVAIEVTMKGASTPLFKILPGERRSLQLAGVEYVFRLNNANVNPNPGYCGTAGWTVFRSDMTIELHEDGGAKTP